MDQKRDPHPTPGVITKYAAMDWAVVVVLAIIELVVHFSEAHKGVFKPWDPQIQFPYKDNTVPNWLLITLAIIPLSIFIGTYLWKRKTHTNSGHDLHRLILCFVINVILTVLTTDTMKKTVGRPRPNAVELSGWVNGTFTASASDVDEAFLSFPSGHASFSFSVFVFLYLFLGAMIYPSKALPNQFWKTVLPMLPLILCTWISCTRLTDYWHNVDDVCAGAAVGAFFAVTMFRNHYHGPSHQLWSDCEHIRPGSSGLTVVPSPKNGEYRNRGGSDCGALVDEAV